MSKQLGKGATAKWQGHGKGQNDTLSWEAWRTAQGGSYEENSSCCLISCNLTLLGMRQEVKNKT